MKSVALRPPEIWIVWGLFLLSALSTAVTYAWVRPDELYHVSETGLEGGVGRTLVFLNFPTALVAVPLSWLAADRLRSRWALGFAAAATALSGVVVVPGVVDQADLDAKPANLVPAVGVGITFGLCVAAARRGWLARRPRRLDSVRVGVAVLVGLSAIPWIAASLGFYSSDVPGLGFLLSEQLRPSPGDAHPAAAVHLGRHHGLDGALLAVSALLLLRIAERTALTVYLSVLLVYGVWNAAEDFFLEQIWKREWTSWRIPSVLRPHLGFAWLLVIVLGVLVAVVVRRLEAPVRPDAGPRRTSPSPPPDRPSAGSRTGGPSP